MPNNNMETHMKNLKTITLMILLGLPIANAGEVSILGGVDLDFNPSIALEYKIPVKNNIFLLSGLRHISESNKIEHYCTALSESFHCESSEYKSKKDTDFYIGVGYDFGKIDVSIYGGLGKSTQKYNYNKTDLKEGSAPIFRENINSKNNADKKFLGLRVNIESNSKNIDFFIDNSLSKYSNSDNLNNKVTIGIKYNF